MGENSVIRELFPKTSELKEKVVIKKKIPFARKKNPNYNNFVPYRNVCSFLRENDFFSP